jgi:hypothetical protein
MSSSRPSSSTAGGAAGDRRARSGNGRGVNRRARRGIRARPTRVALRARRAIVPAGSRDAAHGRAGEATRPRDQDRRHRCIALRSGSHPAAESRDGLSCDMAGRDRCRPCGGRERRSSPRPRAAEGERLRAGRRIGCRSTREADRDGLGPIGYPESRSLGCRTDGHGAPVHLLERKTPLVLLGVPVGWPQRSGGSAPEADALSTELQAREPR